MLVSQPSSGKYVLLGGMLVVGTIALAVYLVTTLDRKVKEGENEINTLRVANASLQQKNNQLTQQLGDALQETQTFSQTLQSAQQQRDAALLENRTLKAAYESVNDELDLANAKVVSLTQALNNQPANVASQPGAGGAWVDVGGPSSNQPANVESQPDAGLTIWPGIALTMTPLFSLAAGIGFFYQRKLYKMRQEQQLAALRIHNALLAEKIVEMRQHHWHELQEAHRLTRQ